MVLTDAGALALLDWEAAEPDGLAGLDLVYFLTSTAFAIEKSGIRRAYARLFGCGAGSADLQVQRPKSSGVRNRPRYFE